jgi:hypothetical protein
MVIPVPLLEKPLQPQNALPFAMQHVSVADPNRYLAWKNRN